MDAVNRVRDYLLDNVGHMTFPGKPSFDSAAQHWRVPIYCRTEHGALVVGEVALDAQGAIIKAPSREDLLCRLKFEAALKRIPDVEPAEFDRISRSERQTDH